MLSPWLTQPSKAGTSTQKPPSSASCTTSPETRPVMSRVIDSGRARSLTPLRRLLHHQVVCLLLKCDGVLQKSGR